MSSDPKRPAVESAETPPNLSKVALVMYTLFLLANLGLALVFASYLGFLFWMHDFDPNFLAIDACSDGGGRWNESDRRCDPR